MFKLVTLERREKKKRNQNTTQKTLFYIYVWDVVCFYVEMLVMR